MAKKKNSGDKPGREHAPTSSAKTDGAPDKGKKKGKPASSMKAGFDFLGLLVGAVAIALLIKGYAFDVYLIPSGSMETALHGRPDGGDRIFCSKIDYRFRKPERWEVAVFEFPYETARRSDVYNISEQYKGQNFVKRVVGLPGEALAIANGDIWVRPDGATEFTRLVKPDSVQRGMWQNVYVEDFSDLRRDELDAFWRVTGDVELSGKGPLILKPGREEARMVYKPMHPSSPDREEMIELPGIPDRYTLRQPVQFRCPTILPDGSECGHLFVKTIATHNFQARCPVCGTLLDETAVEFYHRRSGLPGVGKYAIDPRRARQGEDTPPRQSDYHFVPDLRTVVEATLAEEASTFIITHREDDRYINARFHGDGLVELEINGQPATALQRGLAPIRPGQRHRLEFYVIDGTARVFVDGAETPVLDMEVWKDKRPLPRSLTRISGVSLAAVGAEVLLYDIAIDRDIFYYSGWEYPNGEKFAQMSSQGEVYINSNSFLPMGDHAPSSFDARSWGPVPLDLLRGPARFIWWPPERAGVIPSPRR